MCYVLRVSTASENAKKQKISERLVCNYYQQDMAKV